MYIDYKLLQSIRFTSSVYQGIDKTTFIHFVLVLLSKTDNQVLN